MSRRESPPGRQNTPSPMTGSPSKVTPAAVSAAMISVSVLRCRQWSPVSKSRIVARATDACCASWSWLQCSMARAARHCNGLSLAS